MRKFDELKKLAEAATQGHWEYREADGMAAIASPTGWVMDDLSEQTLRDTEYCAAANPAAILELLAIQAQLVEALKLFTDFPEDVLTMPADDNYTFSVQGRYFATARAALTAAGAQP